MTYQGVTTRKTRCAICKVDVPRGTLVWFDPTKSQGSHIAHEECWNNLKASRGDYQKPTKKRKIRSTEPLDPPF